MAKDRVDFKYCNNCRLEKTIENFSKSKRLNYQALCKLCASLYQKKYRADNKSTLFNKGVEYRAANKDRIAETKKEYVRKNADKLSIYGNNYIKNRSKKDIGFRLVRNLRAHLATAIAGAYKSGSAVSTLGCSIDQLKKHLESKFQPGMTWENWSRTGWHIDHIRPLSSFDLSDIEQLKQACHYSNLQPLWAKDNMRKSDKYEN